jgi:hypothetical protein
MKSLNAWLQFHCIATATDTNGRFIEYPNFSRLLGSDWGASQAADIGRSPAHYRAAAYRIMQILHGADPTQGPHYE